MTVFKHVSKGRDSISYQEFEKTFKSEVPKGAEWETTVIRKIRDWMIKNGLSSETVFDMFLNVTGKIIKKRLSRIDFHKAINSDSELSCKFSAPEIDALFTLIDINKDNELDVEEWK